MDQDAAYALLGAGVLIGGGGIAKAALDELLDPHKRERYAVEKAERARIPMSRVDKGVKFVLQASSLAFLGIKLYDWYKTGKAPTVAI